MPDFGQFTGQYNEEVRVYPSSAATRPCIWLNIKHVSQQPADNGKVEEAAVHMDVHDIDVLISLLKKAKDWMQED